MDFYYQKKYEELYSTYCNPKLEGQASKFVVGKEKYIVYGFYPLLSKHSKHLQVYSLEDFSDGFPLLQEEENKEIDLEFLLVWSSINGSYQMGDIKDIETYFKMDKSDLYFEHMRLFPDYKIKKRDKLSRSRLLKHLLYRKENTASLPTISKKEIKELKQKMQEKLHFYFNYFQVEFSNPAWIDYVSCFQLHEYISDQVINSYFQPIYDFCFHPFLKLSPFKKEEKKKEIQDWVPLSHIILKRLQDRIEWTMEDLNSHIPTSMLIKSYAGTFLEDYHEFAFYDSVPGFIRDWIQENIFSYKFSQYDASGSTYICHSFEIQLEEEKRKEYFLEYYFNNNTGELFEVLVNGHSRENLLIFIQGNNHPLASRSKNLFTNGLQICDDLTIKEWEALTEFYQHHAYSKAEIFIFLINATQIWRSEELIKRALVVNKEQEIYKMKDGKYKDLLYTPKYNKRRDVECYFVKEEQDNKFVETGEYVDCYGNLKLKNLKKIKKIKN